MMNLTWAERRAIKRGGIPIIPFIHQAVYEAACQPGALDMCDWHTCKTTHCRAGWVVRLAGEAGAAIEKRYGTQVAANLIYAVSDPTLENKPDFYEDDDIALYNMKRLAKAEKARIGPKP